MPKGLPKAYIKKWGISKKAWREFRKGTLTGGIRTRTRAIKRRLKGKNPRKRRVKRTARRRRRRSRSITIPIAPVAGLAAGLAAPVQAAMTGNMEQAADLLVAKYTGYSMRENRWNFNYLKEGMVPLILGLVVHKFVGGPPLNLNRVLARANVPFIRI